MKMKLKPLYLLLIAIIWVASACSLIPPLSTLTAEPEVQATSAAPELPGSAQPPVQSAGAVAAPDIAGGAPGVGGGGDVYPQSPEMVVNSFLAAYQDNQAEMFPFLSASRLLAMPEGGMQAMLGITGNLEGFAIQSAAVSTQPPAASLDVGMVVDGTEILRRFQLIFEEDRWVIDAVENPAP
ncbi:MAG: hypothetical protein IT308_05165 [Anaerolineaceae bacterium]|nr:hypothetical protein [Anaerolineaceae bacterium]